MSTRDVLNQTAEEHGMNSGLFQFEKSGAYKLRLLTKPVALATHFFGRGQTSAICFGADKGCPFHGERAPKDEDGNEKRPSVKFVTYLINRATGKIQLGELPWSVISAIADFEEDEDYAFKEYPMPYDIKVTVDKENKDPKQIYKTLASPKQEALTGDEMVELKSALGKMTPEAYVDARKQKQMNKGKPNEYPVGPSPEEIPF